jgi:phosphohistidine phosphatase SixA
MEEAVMDHSRRSTLLIVLLVWLATPVALAQAADVDALVQALRGGGHVLVMRHAHAPRELPAAGSASAENKALERELDSAGRDSATAMGEALRKLRISLGTVHSSPTFRAMQTVRLAGFGEPQAAEQLGDRPPAADRDAWLRSRAAEVPPAGRNTLFVTHAPNIAGAFSEGATGMADGETLILKPDGSGRASVVGRIRIEEWPAIAAR